MAEVTRYVCTAGEEYTGRPYQIKTTPKGQAIELDGLTIRTQYRTIKNKYDKCLRALRSDINVSLAYNHKPILTDEEYDAIEKDWVGECNRRGLIPRGEKKDRPTSFCPNEELQRMEADDTKVEFISKCISNNLVFFNIGMEPVTDDDELCKRLNMFFELCSSSRQIPNMEKMANCIGYDRQWLTDICNGVANGFSPSTRFIVQKAVQILASIDAELATSGKSQPVVYMFRAKNYYKMADTRQLVVENKSPLSGGQTEEQLETKYQEYVDLEGG